MLRKRFFKLWIASLALGLVSGALTFDWVWLFPKIPATKALACGLIVSALVWWGVEWFQKEKNIPTRVGHVPPTLRWPLLATMSFSLGFIALSIIITNQFLLFVSLILVTITLVRGEKKLANKI